MPLTVADSDAADCRFAATSFALSPRDVAVVRIAPGPCAGSALSSLAQGLLALALAVVVQQPENNLIVPRMMGQAVDLHRWW